MYRNVKDPTLYDIVEEFRNTRRLTAARQRGENRSTFTTFRGLGDDSGTTSSHAARNTVSKTTDSGSGSGSYKDASNKKRCVCGSQYHSIEQCFYINEAIRPVNWKPRNRKAKTIQERISKDTVLAYTVNRIGQDSQGQRPIRLSRMGINSRTTGLSTQA